jgi:hypothetical protein
MTADARDRQNQTPDNPPEPGRDALSWLYRSEAFAEDLDEAPVASVVAAPLRRGISGVSDVLRSIGGRFSPGLAG